MCVRVCMNVLKDGERDEEEKKEKKKKKKKDDCMLELRAHILSLSNATAILAFAK